MTGATAKKRRTTWSQWAVILLVFVVLVGLALARAFVLRPFDAQSASMSPTLNPGDYFLVNQSAYDAKPPQRGDVVAFHVPQMNVIYAKRVVGVPGDKVQMRDGVLWINARPLNIRRISDFVFTCGDLRCPLKQFVETLPSGRSYRILDVVDGGPSDNTDVFTVPRGHYFVLGDNRDNSDDSRNFGYVGSEAIIGKVWIKFWDAQRSEPDFEQVR